MTIRNPDTLDLAWKCIYTQDKLTASLGLAIHRGIAKERYSLVIKLLPVIRADAVALEIMTRKLIDQHPKRKQGGRPTLWFEAAEEVLRLSIQTQRAVDDIEEFDYPSNKFKMIKKRLIDCQTLGNLTQIELLNCLPKETNTGQSDVVEQVTALLDTLEMGDEIEGEAGRRWRRK